MMRNLKDYSQLEKQQGETKEKDELLSLFQIVSRFGCSTYIGLVSYTPSKTHIMSRHIIKTMYQEKPGLVIHPYHILLLYMLFC